MPTSALATNHDRRDIGFDAAAASHFPSLLQRARVLTRDEQDARDLIQETYLKALSRSETFIDSSNLKGWLSTIMRNTFVDGWCRESRRRQLPYEEETTPAPDQEEPPVWAEVHEADLWGAVDQLPEPLRRAFTLFSVDRLSYQAIAAMEGVAVATVGTRVLRARRRLRAILGAGLTTS